MTERSRRDLGGSRPGSPRSDERAPDHRDAQAPGAPEERAEGEGDLPLAERDPFRDAEDR